MYMFGEPAVIKAELFAEIPQKYRKSGPQTAARRGIGGTTLEGPSFDRAGNLYITDVPTGRIFRISPDGSTDLVAEYDGEPNGLKIHKDGRMFIADHHHGLMLLEPGTGKVTKFCEGTEKERFKGVNDLIFASNGDLYFTDQGATGLHDPTGRVFRMEPNGRLTMLIDTVPSPNGIVLDREESSLYVAATRASAIWHMPFSVTGGLVKVGQFAQVPVQGPDGMAIDQEGNVAVANPFLGVVWLFDRRGIPIARVDSCTGPMVFNIAYGGPGNQWLYICEGSGFSVIRAKMPHPGQFLYSHA
jgi:gluconolactonase